MNDSQPRKRWKVYVCSSLHTIWKDNGELDWDTMKKSCYSYISFAIHESTILSEAKEWHPYCVYLIEED